MDEIGIILVAMHEIAFNTRSSLNFPYVCSSLLVADVDNDGISEIVAGSREGQMAIFKPDDTNAYRTVSKLGLVTAFAVGDLFNRNQIVLTVISADGGCHVFRVSAAHSELQLCLAQPLQSNIKAAQIADVDGDDCQELLVILTDRVVRTYRYLPSKDNHQTGRLLALNKWESPALITAFSSISSSLPQDGLRLVLSQTQDKFVVLQPKLSAENELAGDSNTVDRSVQYCEADPSVQRDRDTIFLSKNADLIALFHLPTMHLVLVDDGMETSVDFHHPIFAVSSIKPTKKSCRVYLACDWRGNVNVFGVDNLQTKRCLDNDNDLVLMQSQSNVSCFAASCGKTELHQCVAKCIVAVSTTSSQLYTFTLPWSKIEKYFKKE